MEIMTYRVCRHLGFLICGCSQKGSGPDFQWLIVVSL